MNTWDTAVKSNALAEFVDTCLRGAGQVMFQNNPLTGLLFIAGIFYAALTTENLPALTWGSIAGLVVSTVLAMVLGVERDSVRAGLYGFNGILVGCALPTFIAWSHGLLLVYIIAGAVLSTIITAALTDVLTTWGVTGLTAPFVLATWLFLLSVVFYSGLKPAGLGTPALPSAADIHTTLRSSATATTGAGVTIQNLAQSTARGVSQVFLQNNWVTGVIFVIALAVSTPWAAGFAVLGSILGMGTALVLGADGISIYNGLYGYNAVLSAIAVGAVFFTTNERSTAYAIVCAVITTVIAGAMDTALSPLGIPALTSAFVLTTWLFLLPKKNFPWLTEVISHVHVHAKHRR